MKQKNRNILGSRIKKYLEHLDPSQIGLDNNIRVTKVKELGAGESNLNYLVVVNDKKFVIRLNMYIPDEHKSINEFHKLKLIERLGISPKVFILEKSKKYLGETFIVTEYFEGQPMQRLGEKLTNDNVKKLAKLVAHIHRLDIDDIKGLLPYRATTPRDLLPIIKCRINYIKKIKQKYIGIGSFETMLEETFQKISSINLNFAYGGVECFGHGDICEQNTIIHNGEFRFIDWEDACITDPAAEVVGIFEGFGILFPKLKEGLFLDEYLKARPDKTLRKRINYFRPVLQFGHMSWAIMHVFELEEGEMHRFLMERKNLKEDIAFAMKVYNICVNSGVVAQRWAHFKPENIFPRHYLKKAIN